MLAQAAALILVMYPAAVSGCRKALFKFSWRGPFMELVSSATGEGHKFDYGMFFGAR